MRYVGFKCYTYLYGMLNLAYIAFNKKNNEHIVNNQNNTSNINLYQ